jgi:serine/threonine protein kinase
MIYVDFEPNHLILYSSPCYASPEIILGQQYEGTAADIWSAGVILYTLVNVRKISFTFFYTNIFAKKT